MIEVGRPGCLFVLVNLHVVGRPLRRKFGAGREAGDPSLTIYITKILVASERKPNFLLNAKPECVGLETKVLGAWLALDKA